MGALPGLAVAVFILLMARAVIGMVTPFFDRVGRGYSTFTWLDRDTAQPTKRLFALGVWLFALAMAYPYLPGSQSQAFQGISVLLGLMVTFGGSSLFGQAASGLILMYSRTLRVGEYVRVDDHEGTVTELGSFTTKVRTGLGEELTLPNSLVLGTVVKNYSRTVKGQGYIVDTTVTIGYDTPWRQVEAMLVEAAHRTQGILDDPAPRVFQTALSDFYPEYRLVCQAIPREPRPRAAVLATLHANIQDVFNEYGVQIMSPHYLGDPRDAKVVPKDELARGAGEAGRQVLGWGLARYPRIPRSFCVLGLQEVPCVSVCSCSVCSLLSPSRRPRRSRCSSPIRPRSVRRRPTRMWCAPGRRSTSPARWPPARTARWWDRRWPTR